MTLSPFRIGRFIGTVITFIIVAFVIFLIVKITKKGNRIEKSRSI
ncbi:MscL family protein [Candidatus Bathyarchaeota archaeon]|nr:MscL family protein [Candidatus Bathyarchaeota archaeon]